MRACSSCGGENADGAKFCSECGEPLEPRGDRRDARKTVTILFSDVVGSTAIGERLDPETLRDVMGTYFDRMRDAIELHGGTIEKFIGDAIMAVFGLPKVHEDDALRAVRAAVEMEAALDRLNHELTDAYGVQIHARTGVNTGEVVASTSVGDRQRLVTGDTVNVAARLEQAAPTDGTLLGQETYRLVRHAVGARELEPLELKGKSERVRAWSLEALHDDGGTDPRRRGSPFIGRSEERSQVVRAYAEAIAQQRPVAVSVLGPAGVGKSRFVDHTVGRLDPEPLVLTGRCPPYGEGITFWPVAELVKQAARIGGSEEPDEVRRKIDLLVRDVDGAGSIRGVLLAVLGVAGGRGEIDELPWAIRRLLETIAPDRPVVVIVEDLHWAEPGLVQLLSTLIAEAEAPVLFLIAARPEFGASGAMAAIGNGHVRSLDLAPLSPTESSELIDRWLDGQGLPGEVRMKLIDTAGGNPLFVEELLRMLEEDGVVVRSDRGIEVTGSLVDLRLPSSIQALLAARLEQLEQAEIAIVERASIIGQIFQLGDVVHLAPEALRPAAASHVADLVRQDVLQQHGAVGVDDETYRFRHVLIRDAAYGAMPKRVRAELHERFADRCTGADGRRVAGAEAIVGHHYEQAYRYRGELSRAGGFEYLADAAVVAFRGSAGRALELGDVAGARAVLARALPLARSATDRVWLQTKLGAALREGAELGEAQRVLDDAVAGATELGDVSALSIATAERLEVDMKLNTPDWRASVRSAAEDLIPQVEEIGDDRTLAKLWRMASWAFADVDHHGFEAASGRSIDHARRAGDRVEEIEVLAGLATSAFETLPTVADAISRCEDLLGRVEGNGRAEAFVLGNLAEYQAAAGRFDEARTTSARSEILFRRVGAVVHMSYVIVGRGTIERLAGDVDAAVAHTQQAIDGFDQGQEPPLVRADLLLSRVEQGRRDVVTQLLGGERALADDTIEEPYVRLAYASANALVDRPEIARQHLGRSLASMPPHAVSHLDALCIYARVAAVSDPDGSIQAGRTVATIVAQRHLDGLRWRLPRS